jgi:hypothetical protein
MKDEASDNHHARQNGEEYAQAEQAGTHGTSKAPGPECCQESQTENQSGANDHCAPTQIECIFPMQIHYSCFATVAPRKVKRQEKRGRCRPNC